MNVNVDILTEAMQMGLKRSYHSHSTDDYDFGGVTLWKSPFKVVQVDRFVRNAESFTTRLKDAIVPRCSVERNNDLLKLFQTTDLKNVDSLVIQEFMSMLKTTMVPWLQELLGYQLKSEAISITGSLYKKGGHLLCHDDKMDDRAVAFVYYLNSLKPPSGCFEVFDHDEWERPDKIVRSVPPKRNRFIFFEVSNTSFHQVSEVLDDDWRISINGWFHADITQRFSPHPVEPIQSLVQPYRSNSNMNFLNKIYSNEGFMAEALEKFEEDSCIAMMNFLCPAFHARVHRALGHECIVWKQVGPPNIRNYDVASVSCLPPSVTSLVRHLRSSLFLQYLKRITQLELVLPDVDECQIYLEVRRYCSGNYSMVTSNNTFFDIEGLDVYIFFKEDDLPHDCGGSICYVISDGSEAPGEDSELATIFPADNSFFAIYRTTDTSSFFKYLEHAFPGTIYCLAATYYLSTI